MKRVYVTKISKKSLERLIELGYTVVICGWGKYTPAEIKAVK